MNVRCIPVLETETQIKSTDQADTNSNSSALNVADLPVEAGQPCSIKRAGPFPYSKKTVLFSAIMKGYCLKNRVDTIMNTLL